MNDDFEFEEALNRAIQRGNPAGDRQRCDPCQAKFLQCCAMARALVRNYAGADPKPAPGSVWDYPRRWPEVDAELKRIAAIPGVPGSMDCDSCRIIRDPSKCTRPALVKTMSLEQALEVTLERARTDPTMQSDTFRSIEGLRRACDPAAVGVYSAAANRGAFHRFAATGEFQGVYADTQNEPAELAAAGHVMPSCGCRGVSCGLPAKAVTS
jgi:hypothetical protein